MDEIPAHLRERLVSLGIGFQAHSHAPLFTVDQSRELRGSIPGGHTKNLFLKDKKGGLYLLTALEETSVNLKVLHQHIGARSRLSFGSSELLQEKLGVLPGAVTPLAALNDQEGAVSVYLDHALMEYDKINCHPLINTMTLSMAPADLLKFLKSTGHVPNILEIPG